MADVREYGADGLVALLPLPAADANKYTRGRLVVVAGSARYPGAACLAACAGQRAGAGYTEVVCAPEAVDLVRSCRSSLVVRSWLGWGAADLTADAPGKPVAFALGSGFDAEDAACMRNAYLVLKHAEAPVLVDGGALAALSTPKGRRLLKRRFVRGLPTVVTPHGGEAARLAEPFGLSTDDPAGLARLIALAYGVVAVVKGPDTFVSDGDDAAAVPLRHAGPCEGWHGRRARGRAGRVSGAGAGADGRGRAGGHVACPGGKMRLRAPHRHRRRRGGRRRGLAGKPSALVALA